MKPNLLQLSAALWLATASLDAATLTVTSTADSGPMAQDFKTAFGLGLDDKFIATVDADGVALAAIQGLHELPKEQNARISKQEQRLARIEKLMGGSIPMTLTLNATMQSD